MGGTSTHNIYIKRDIKIFILSFTFRSHLWCKKSEEKEKSQSREWNVCARQMSISATFVLNKIMPPIF